MNRLNRLGRVSPRQFSLRIVMPVLNEQTHLTERLKKLQKLKAHGTEIVVVDGGSTDESWAIASHWADRVVFAPRGRASQMNAGAVDTPCSQAYALLFLHADTQLPDNASALIAQALKQDAWGRFDVQLDSLTLALRVVSWAMNFRSRITSIATGDQGIFVRSSVFQKIGGFPAQALMEDVELSSRLKSVGKPACLRHRVLTSARKWEQHGVWQTILLMWKLRLAYFCGAKPDKLAKAYGYQTALEQSYADIAILAKAPLAGLAKTRLIPLLGAAGAGRAQRAFLLQTVRVAKQSKLGAVSLWCTPGTQHVHFRAIERVFEVQTQLQPRADLGARMQLAFETHFAKNPTHPLILIGTDCPVLSPGHLEQAARALQSHDVVLIPAQDGGYVLIGTRKPITSAFQGISWSTDQVMQQTRQQLRLSGATWQELPILWDIDEPADWLRFQKLKGIS